MVTNNPGQRLPALAAEGFRKGKFPVPAEEAERPGGGVAKAFADILPPAARAPLDVGGAEACETLLGGPAQLAGGSQRHLLTQKLFPAAAFGVGKPHPDEVEEFVKSDAGKLAGRAAERLIEHKPALADEAGGMNFLPRTFAEHEPAPPGAEAARPGEADGAAFKPQSGPGANAYCFGEPPPRYDSSLNSIWSDFWTLSIHSRNRASRSVSKISLWTSSKAGSV